jgi:small nuclear ribonucleoprotein (snRNP)-like protein
MSSNLSVNLLNEFINKPILIKLRNNHTIKGTLQTFDDRMNLVLEKSDDIISEKEVESLGKIILRGDNILIIAVPSK